MGPWVNAVHPGAVATDQPKQATDPDAFGKVGAVGVTVLKPFLKDAVTQGCRPALFAACSDDVVKGEGIQGCYIEPDRKVVEPSAEARDDALGERLWTLSEEILREKLGGLPWVKGEDGVGR